MGESYNHNEFDELFRSKLEGHQQSGTNALWESVSGNFAQIDEEKKKKKRIAFFWWITSGLLAMLILTIGYYEWRLNSFSQRIEEQQQQLSALKNQPTTTHTNHTSNSSSKSIHQQTEEQAGAQQTNNIHSVRMTPALSMLPKRDNSLYVYGEANRSGVRLNQQRKSLPENDNSLLSPSDRTLNFSNTIGEENSNDLDTANNTSLSLTENTPNNINKTAPTDTTTADSTNTQLTKVSETTSLPIPDPKKKKQLSLALTGSPDFSYRWLSGNSENAVSGMGVKQFNQAESGRVGYSIGAQLNYEISPRLSVFSGLEFSRHKQTFEASNYDAFLDTTNRIFTLNTSFGDVNFKESQISEPNEVNTNGEQASLSFKSRQQLSILSIPIGVQYGFDLSPKHRIFVQSGLRFNAILSGSTTLNLSDGKGGGEGGEHAIRIKGFKGLTPFNFGASIGVGYEWSFTQRLSLIANPTFRMSFTPINEKNGVKPFPFSLGLRTGIKWNL